jgi:hypothetical protein
MTKGSQGLFHKCLMLVERIRAGFHRLDTTIDYHFFTYDTATQRAGSGSVSLI